MSSVGRAYRVIAIVFFAAFTAASFGIGIAGAQTQTPTVSAFLSNPNSLLQQNPNGGTGLQNSTQELALADPTTFKPLLGLLGSANDQQKVALATGLVQATKILVLTNQPLATEWQLQIAAITDPTFKTAATNAFGDVKLGAIGGGPLGAVGGGVGQTNSLNQGPGGPGPLENLSSPGVVTQNFFTNASTSAGTSVSP